MGEFRTVKLKNEYIRLSKKNDKQKNNEYAEKLMSRADEIFIANMKDILKKTGRYTTIY